MEVKGTIVMAPAELRLALCLSCGADLRIPWVRAPPSPLRSCPICQSNLVLSDLPWSCRDFLDHDMGPTGHVDLPPFLTASVRGSHTHPGAISPLVATALESAWNSARERYSFDLFMNADEIAQELEQTGIHPQRAWVFACRILDSLRPR
jgi:hypothetical protein